MVTEKNEQLQALKAKVAELEAQVAATRQSELAALPERFGFPSVSEFVAAVKEAGGVRSGRRGRPPGTVKSTAVKGRGGRRRRAKITDETRAEVKKLVGAGKTGDEIASALGISLPSVQNIKKALGLVRASKKKSS